MRASTRFENPSRPDRRGGLRGALVALAGAAAALAGGPAPAQSWTAQADLITPRFDLVAARSKNRIYAIGGMISDTTVTAAAEKYCPGAGAWTSIAAMPTPRARMAAAVGPGGVIYVAGGATGPAATTVVEAYDPVSGVWSARQSMPAPRARWAAAPGPNGKLYFFGGENSSGYLKASFYEFDPAAGPIVNGHPYGVWTHLGAMPRGPRNSLAATLGCNGMIYVTGGNGTGMDKVVEVYDPVLDQWLTTGPDWAPDLNIGMGGHAAVTSRGGTIYVLGAKSYNDSDEVIQSFTPGVDTSWNTLADGNSTSLPAGRWLGTGLAAVSTGSQIYTLGGTNRFHPGPEMVHRYGSLGLASPACSTLFPVGPMTLCRMVRAFAQVFEALSGGDLLPGEGTPAGPATVVVEPFDPAVEFEVRVEPTPSGALALEWAAPPASPDLAAGITRLALEVLDTAFGATLAEARFDAPPGGAPTEGSLRLVASSGATARLSVLRAGRRVAELPDMSEARIVASLPPSGFAAQGAVDGAGSRIAILWSRVQPLEVGGEIVEGDEVRITSEPGEGREIAAGLLRGEGFPRLTLLPPARNLPPNDPRPRFRRGDTNGDGGVDISDAVAALAYLFAGGVAPSCTAAADANGDGGVDVADPIASLDWLFRGGRALPAPGPFACGADPASGELPCQRYAACGDEGTGPE